MKSILVIGAGGYIGSILVQTLLSRNYRVRAIDRFLFGKQLLLSHPNLEIVEKDARDLRWHDFKSVNVVIDLAALSNDPLGIAFSESTLEINYRARVKNACQAKSEGVTRYILGSSCSVYGKINNDVVSEHSELKPLTLYAEANVLAENEIIALADDTFLPVCLRQATAFGYSPRMRFDLAVNIMTYCAWKYKRIRVDGDGKQWRPFTHVRDLANAFCHFTKLDDKNIQHHVYNVGANENNLQIAKLAKLIAEQCPRAVNITYGEIVDCRSYKVEFSRIKSTGFRVSYSIRDGIEEILQALECKLTDRTIETVTLDYYRQLSAQGVRI